MVGNVLIEDDIDAELKECDEDKQELFKSTHYDCK